MAMASQFVEWGFSSTERAAYCQMIACIKAVYSGQLDAIAPLLPPSGRIADSHIEATTWPPSFIIIESSPGDYIIVMEGTTQPVAQGLWHAYGTFGYAEEGGAAVNGQWRTVADTIIERMLAVSGTEPEGVTWRISGHSYGGAVGYVVAGLLVNRFPGWRVEVITVGAPRARGAGYAGRRPDLHYRLESTGDPVPLLPPAGLYPALTADLSAWLPYLPYVAWAQYGIQKELGRTGVIDMGEVIPSEGLPAGISNSPLEAHGTLNYYSRFRYFYEQNGGTPPTLQALNLYAQMIDAHELPQPPGLPTFQGSLANPQYFAPTIYPFAPPGVPAVAAPVYLSLTQDAGTLFKVTTLLNIIDPGGESENFYVWFGNPYPADTAWTTLLTNLNTLRRGILTNAAQLLGNRTSRVLPTKGRGRPWRTNPNVNPGIGGVNGPRVVGNNSANWTIFDASQTFQRTYTTRFLPAPYAEFGSGTTSHNVGFNPALGAWRDAFIAQLVPPQNGNTPSGFIGAIRVIDPRPDINGRANVRAYYLVDGRLNIEVVGGISGASRGTKLLLHHSAQDCIKGLTGEATILAEAPGVITGTTRYALNRGYCCDPATLVNANGSVQRLVYAAVGMANMVAVSLSTRDTGRPSDARRGRRQKKCC